ncbi:MAG TPA: metal ABC transporter ATP-binding protein [Bacilli bacterium]|nr:metal ABC transporter ATP-binding protein [Bacilli bacterium]
MSAIKIFDLTVSYDLKPVLWDIDLEIPLGALVAVVGPNGAGKSTLIQAILGLVKRVSGEVSFLDQPYKNVQKRIAYVPQRGSVDWDFPTTVFDVVLMGRYGHVGWIKRPSKKDKDKTIEALNKVNMLEFKDRQISELSGGQQQRVFLARALVQEAEIYLMDEPFVGVDAKTEKAIVMLLKELKNNNKTVVVVHHDLQTVKEYFDYVVLLNRKIIAFGLVDDVFSEELIRTTYQEHSLLKSGEDHA